MISSEETPGRQGREWLALDSGAWEKPARATPRHSREPTCESTGGALWLAASSRSQRDVNFCLCLELSTPSFHQLGAWSLVENSCPSTWAAHRELHRTASGHPATHAAGRPGHCWQGHARGISPCCSSELDTGRSPLACGGWGLSSIMPREVLPVGAQCWPCSCYWTRSSGPCCLPLGSQLIRDKCW